jgi:cell division protein FtsQ
LKLKNKIFTGLWLLLALSIVVLCVAAVGFKKNSLCRGIAIELLDNNNSDYYVDIVQVKELLGVFGDLKKLPTNKINIAALEKAIKNDKWILDANLFFDNNNLLHVNILQRQPIARMFNVDGSSCYLDSAATRLTINKGAIKRLPVIANFPTESEELTGSDSVLLLHVKNISNYIANDSFFSAQIAQINILNNSNFEFIPAIGTHNILFGNGENVASKFNKLFVFYKKAWFQNGCNTYQTLDVRYSNQVVATRVGFVNVIKDSISYPVNFRDSVSNNLFTDTLFKNLQ